MKTQINKKYHELLSVSYYKAPLGKSITPHVIPRGVEYIELLVAGKVYFCPEGFKKNIEFGCGAMFWHIEGEYTIHLADPKEPYECLCLRFLVSKKERTYPRVSVWENRDDALSFSNTILNLFHSKLLAKEKISQYVYSKISWEAELFLAKSHSFVFPKNLEKIRKFIDDNYSSDITVSDIANAAGISVPHLHSLSKKIFNRTPHELLLDKRLAEARKSLLTTRTAIKEISSSCGFSNIETFYRAFRRRYLTTPASLREENEPRRILSLQLDK